MLEKSASVRLGRSSLPLLSHHRWFFSWKEATTLLLSSGLLFFCRNPKWSQDGDPLVGCMGAFPNICTSTLSISSLDKLSARCLTVHSRVVPMKSPAGGFIYGRRTPRGWGLSQITSELQPRQNNALLMRKCRFPFARQPRATEQQTSSIQAQKVQYSLYGLFMNGNVGDEGVYGKGSILHII